MTDNRKAEKSFDLDKLDLIEPDPGKKAPPKAPAPPPVPHAPFDPGERPVAPEERPETNAAPGPRINRPAKILLTVLFAATALTWFFLLLIVIWESILN